MARSDKSQARQNFRFMVILRKNLGGRARCSEGGIFVAPILTCRGSSFRSEMAGNSFFSIGFNSRKWYKHDRRSQSESMRLLLPLPLYSGGEGRGEGD